MRVRPTLTARLCLLLACLCAQPVLASEEQRLLEAINQYRSQPQSCAGQASVELPPLHADARLQLPPSGSEDLQQALARSGYPLVNARAISLSGPRTAEAALAELARSFCGILLDPQYVDVAISQAGRDWRIVLGRPLLAGRLGDWQAEGQRLLELVNQARATARRCGEQAFAASPALRWNALLGSVAEAHSRAMANGNFFSHRDADGRIPGDRAELAGYEGTRLGENIAAALDAPDRVLQAWLASPGHCANLMNPQFSELGAAYAVDPASDAGIYWTLLLGAP